MLPTYEEGANITTVLRLVRKAAPEVDVLVVDDASPDGTADLAEAAADELGGITVLRRLGKGGLGGAYRAGFSWGLAEDYDALVEMDADLSHDPERLPDLLDALGSADLVIGSRYVPGGSIRSWSLRRRLMSRLGNRYASFALALPCSDLTSGYRAYRAEMLRRIDLDGLQAGGYGFQIEMAYLVARAGGRIVEVPICFTDRVEGRSKMSARIAIEALVLVSTTGLRRMLGRPGALSGRAGAGRGVRRP